jgi:hypothetical protein
MESVKTVKHSNFFKIINVMIKIIMNIMKLQDLRFLGFKSKAFLFFHLCLGRPISVVPEVTTDKLAWVDDFLPFVSWDLSISSDTILYA